MTYVEEKAHAVLGPSGWPTWGTCAGSVPLSEGIVDKGSIYADEGTAGHSLLETCVLEGFDAEDLLGKTYTVGTNTFTVGMEMADAVNTAIAYIKSEIDVDKGDILMAEQSVPIGHLTGETGAEGTSDIVGITHGGKRMVIADFKYGKGVTVYASDRDGNPNGQLAMYALGALEKFGLIYDDIETVLLMVLQPRKDHFDMVELTIDELRAFGEEVTLAAGRVELNKQVYLEGNELDLVPGEKQCKFCKAKAICPALKAEVSKSLATISTASDPAEFEDLSLSKKASSVSIGDHTDPMKLAEFMRAAPLIEEAIKAVRAEVERRLFAGDVVPGYKLVEGKKGNRQWADKDEAAKELTKGGRLKSDQAFEKTPISPTKAEKLLKDRPKIWSKIAPLIIQPDGRPSVAPESDKRPAYQIASALEDFADLSETSPQPAGGGRYLIYHPESDSLFESDTLEVGDGLAENVTGLAEYEGRFAALSPAAEGGTPAPCLEDLMA